MILLKFGTEIKGDSKVEGHDNWITIDTLNFNVHRDITASGKGTDRDLSNPHISEVVLTKSSDMSSSDLFSQACGGKSLGKAEIHFIQTGGDKSQVFLKYELTDAIVSSYSISSGGERPVETIGLNYTQIKTQYDQFSGDKVATGTMKGWDLMVNKPT